MSDLLIMLLKSDFTKGGDEKFSWGEPTEAKNPKKIRKKFSFSKSTPLVKVEKGAWLANRTQHTYTYINKLTLCNVENDRSYFK